MFLHKYSVSLLASNVPVSHRVFLSCWQKKDQWKIVFWMEISIVNHKLHVIPKKLAMASQQDISYAHSIAFSQRLPSRSLLVPDSSGLCSAQKFQRWFVQYTHWFGSERKHSVSILFLLSIQMYIKTSATAVSFINKTNRNWSGMIGGSLRVTPDVAMCQLWSSTERTAPNQNIFQDDWESKRICRWKG